eukprot:31518-Pelagococcus_subviridis.AAC.5
MIKGSCSCSGTTQLSTRREKYHNCIPTHPDPTRHDISASGSVPVVARATASAVNFPNGTHR